MTSIKTNEAWLDDLAIALRLRNVSGEAIGDALAVVREHLADSGQTAHQAFGDPAAYARELELPTVAATRPLDPPVMGPAVSLLGLLAFAPAVAALFDGTSMAFSLPQLVLFMVPVAVVLGLPYYFNLGLRHLWVFAVAFILAIVASTGASFLAPERGHAALASWNPWVVALASAVLMLAASTWGVLDAWRTEPDPIVDPVSPDEADSARRHRFLEALPHLLIPLAGLACIAASRLLG